MKNLLIVFISLLFVACGGSKEKSLGLLPDSQGELDEILVVIQDEDWKGELGDSVRNVLIAPYEILPQYEPAFTPRQVSYDKMVSLLKRTRTMLFITSFDQNTSLTSYVKKTIAENSIDPLPAGKKGAFFSQKDVWASPQKLIFVYANTRQELLDYLSENSDKLRKVLQQHESVKATSMAFASGKNFNLTNKLNEDYKIDLNIPKSFQQGFAEEDFFWIRKELDKSSNSIMIGTKPYADVNQLSVDSILVWRDDLGKQYVGSEIEGSYMYTDTNHLGILVDTIQLNGNYTIQIRGLWALKNDFMGGPFSCYVIHDKANERLVLVDNFVHAPSTKKRPLIRQLEVISKRIKFVL